MKKKGIIQNQLDNKKEKIKVIAPLLFLFWNFYSEIIGDQTNSGFYNNIYPSSSMDMSWPSI